MADKNTMEKEKLTLTHELEKMTNDFKKMQEQFEENNTKLYQERSRYDTYRLDIEKRLKDENERAMEFKSRS